MDKKDLSEKSELVVVPLTPKVSQNVYIKRKCLQLSLEILGREKKR